jgi:S-adenosylmethionine decarboxylase
MTNYQDKGWHLIGKLSKIENQALIEDGDFVLKTLNEAVIDLGLTKLKEDFHKFEPQGLTAFVIISESHLAFHSYPESNSAFIDIFSCKNHPPEMIKKTFKKLAEKFTAQEHKETIIFRE